MLPKGFPEVSILYSASSIFKFFLVKNVEQNW